MERIGNLLKKLTDLDNIAKSTKKTASTRKRQPQVASALKDLEKFSNDVRDAFLRKDFSVGKIIERDILEGTSLKPRHIAYLASFKKQVMLSVIFDLVGEKLAEKSYPFTYGSLPKRGAKHLCEHIKKWLFKDRRNMKYYLQCDIKKCFQSVRHDLAKSACRRFFKDKYILGFFDSLIDSYGENGIGLPIGYLSSPWFAHFVLSQTDYAMCVKVAHYVRYMDDIIMFESNKRRLEMAGQELKKRLGNLGFELHEEPTVRELNKEPFDFVGIVYSNNKVSLRKTLVEKMKTTNSNYEYNPTLKNAMSLVSYNGWVKDSENSKKDIPKNFFKNVESAKNLISNVAKTQAEELKQKNSEQEENDRKMAEIEAIEQMEKDEKEFLRQAYFSENVKLNFDYVWKS